MILERIDIDTTEDQLQVVLHRNRYDFVLARLTPGQSVLEIGTGPGTFTRELVPKCGSYVGVEYDHETCLAARQKSGGRVEIIEADAKRLPFEAGRFSFIICLEVLEHLGDFQAGVKEIYRCLRADGMAIASVPYRRSGGKSKTNPYHLYEPGERELVGLLESLFDTVEVYYQWFPETRLMTVARKLHIRRFLGLTQIYADLSAGLPHATSQFRISPQPRGLIEGLIVVARDKKLPSA